jgi:hypothetical protein
MVVISSKLPVESFVFSSHQLVMVSMPSVPAHVPVRAQE